MMKRVLLLTIVLLLLVLLSGCFRSRNEVVQSDPVAYLKFTGNIKGVVVTVTRDDGRVVMREVTVKARKRYTTKPGTCEVLVVRDGEPIVHRKLFVVDGQTSEVRVP